MYSKPKPEPDDDMEITGEGSQRSLRRRKIIPNWTKNILAQWYFAIKLTQIFFEHFNNPAIMTVHKERFQERWSKGTD